MSFVESADRFRVAILSVVKHDYVAKGMLSHGRFEPAVVADDADQPDWVHSRNQKFADEFHVPNVRDVAAVLADYRLDIAVIS